MTLFIDCRTIKNPVALCLWLGSFYEGDDDLDFHLVGSE